MRMSTLVLSCLAEMHREKVLKNIFLVLGQEAQLRLPRFQQETHRYPSCWVGLQAVGGVPGEGQSVHLVSRFVSSAPTCVLSALCGPEQSWNKSADCCDCCAAVHLVVFLSRHVGSMSFLIEGIWITTIGYSLTYVQFRSGITEQLSSAKHTKTNWCTEKC